MRSLLILLAIVTLAQSLRVAPLRTTVLGKIVSPPSPYLSTQHSAISTSLHSAGSVTATEDGKTNKFVKIVYQVAAALSTVLIFYPPCPFKEDKIVHMIAAMNSFILSSAASRARLSGTTFKLLNTATMSMALPLTISSLRNYKQVFKNKVGIMMFFTYLFQTKGSFKSLRVYGFPSLKIEKPNSLLSLGYVLSFVTSLYVGVNQMHLNPSLDGICAMIVVPTIHYILSLASNANRLNSATYRELNILVVLASLIKLINNGFQWSMLPSVFSAFHGTIATLGLLQSFFIKK